MVTVACSDSSPAQPSATSSAAPRDPAASLDALVPGLSALPFIGSCSDGGTAALRECQADLSAKSERLLDQTLAELRSTALAGTDSLLDDSQHAWLTYRDATCNYSAAQYEGGSIEPIISGACRIAATRDRIRQLQETCDKVPCTPPGWQPGS